MAKETISSVARAASDAGRPGGGTERPGPGGPGAGDPAEEGGVTRPRGQAVTAAGHCATLGDAALLAVLLDGGRGDEDRAARKRATAWLRRRGGWRAPPGRPDGPGRGGGEADAAIGAVVGAALELARRYHRADLDAGPGLTSPRQSAAYLQAELRDRRQEVFACLFLDTRHRVLAFEELFRGSIDGACVYPRVVAERALTLGAAAVIAAHNHPSGVAEPSLSDQAITHRLRDALALIDVRLLDHFVIGAGRPVSLAERGLV